MDTKCDQRLYLYKQALATAASSLIALYCGMTFGFTAMMLPKLREDSSMNYDPKNDSWIASIASLSMIIGSVCCGTILDSYGRKMAHIIAGIPAILGWSLIACANSTGLILVGRFSTGISTAAIRIVTMVYIGEITDPKFRSIALFLPSVTGYVGILVSHIAGHYLPWKFSAAVCVIPAVISMASSVFLKESPLWLIAKGRVDDGIEHFKWFRGTSQVSEMELKSILESQAKKQKLCVSAFLKIARQISFIKPMLISLVLMFNIQLSGVNVISIYSQDIFKKTFSGKLNAFHMTIAMDCIVNFVCVLCFLLGKLIPKKKAILACNFGAAIFLFGLVMSFYFYRSDNYFWVRIFCVIMYLFFSCGIIAIAWTFVPELLPNSARGFGSGINATFSCLSLFVIVKVTPDIMHSLGETALFSVFGISTLTCGIILLFVLPETNGKTLQCIEDSYDKKKDESSSV